MFSQVKVGERMHWRARLARGCTGARVRALITLQALSYSVSCICARGSMRVGPLLPVKQSHQRV